MTVVVHPVTFQYVEFAAARVEAAASELLERLDMGARDLRIEIDETSPISRVVLVATDPQLVVRAESGAFEDTRRPRALSVLAVATALGRVLLRSRDRAGGRFADAPADTDLSLAQTAAWDAWCVGRLGRLGYPVNQQRWRYNFRNRHGFTDESDRVFDTLWAAEELTWAQLEDLSGRALASRQSA